MSLLQFKDVCDSTDLTVHSNSALAAFSLASVHESFKRVWLLNCRTVSFVHVLELEQGSRVPEENQGQLYERRYVQQTSSFDKVF